MEDPLPQRYPGRMQHGGGERRVRGGPPLFSRGEAALPLPPALCVAPSSPRSAAVG